jgi:hypothetical protein
MEVYGFVATSLSLSLLYFKRLRQCGTINKNNEREETHNRVCGMS